MAAPAEAVPLADIESEARRIVSAARELAIPARLLGGAAIRVRCPSARVPPLARDCKDIDLVAPRRARQDVESLLRELGYEPDHEFNVLNAASRLLFRDRRNGRQLDVLLDRFEMCHALELADRLELDGETLDGADLLLTKLQVLQTNERDLKDALALLLDAPIDEDRVAAVLASDWGWWRTATEVLNRVALYAASLPGLERRNEALGRIASLHRRIEAEPKGVRWRARARVGERVRWHAEPEEDY